MSAGPSRTVRSYARHHSGCRSLRRRRPLHGGDLRRGVGLLERGRGGLRGSGALGRPRRNTAAGTAPAGHGTPRNRDLPEGRPLRLTRETADRRKSRDQPLPYSPSPLPRFDPNRAPAPTTSSWFEGEKRGAIGGWMRGRTGPTPLGPGPSGGCRNLDQPSPSGPLFAARERDDPAQFSA
jgi:hypothetical protein